MERSVPTGRSDAVFAHAAWHSLCWLVFANAVGVLIALLLVAPAVNGALGDWTYGRWLPVHMNLQLYGWISLPLVAFLFKAYGADSGPAARWCGAVLWVWSAALTAGTRDWLGGHSSGKLFLDWNGYTRVLFPLALLSLWVLLAFSFASGSRKGGGVRIAGLALLLAVPVLLYVAASPTLYPPINPDTGGPTGASQLESTLVIIAILLLLPFGLTRRNGMNQRYLTIAWAVFTVEFLLCFALGRTDVSHHRPAQFISLGSLLVWIPLIPAYYKCFVWRPETRRWRMAFLIWWAVLIPTGWCLFLPGVLDRFKFTDGLVGHSLLAMAGFASSLLIFVMVQLLGEGGWIFNTSWSFRTWHISVLCYVLLMFFAGWREGAEPAFSLVPGALRNGIYGLRLLLGILLFAASFEWLVNASKLPFQVAEEQPA